MVGYLTSSPTGSYRDDSPKEYEGFNPANGFLEHLKKDWKENSRCLMICADPESYDQNDEMGEYFQDVLQKNGLTFSEFTVCDRRNGNHIILTIRQYDFILLGGGHVPTQKAFFDSIHLKYLLNRFDGMVMGISAGSMNCAEEVYALPESQGEVKDPKYRRFIEGLGLTKAQLIPHYQAIRDDVLDDKRIIEEVACLDSVGRRFILLVDGSYILCRDGEEILYGEGYELINGKVQKICENGQSCKIN